MSKLKFNEKMLELYIYFSRKGFKDTLLRLYSNYFHVLNFILYKRDICDGFTGISLEPQFRCIESDLDLLRKERKANRNLPREFYIDQSHGGKFFYLVYHENEIAYIHWIFRRGEYSRFFSIQDDAIFEFNYNFTLPKFRGNRLQAKTMNYICEDMKRKGFKIALGAVSTGNILSVKGMAKTGLKEFRRVHSYFSFVKKTKVSV
jgi:hypothetical protein